MHEAMDQRLIVAEDSLDTYHSKKDMDRFYKTMSEAIENGWLTYFGEGKEFERAAKGRGKVILIKTKVAKPKIVEEENMATIRNQFSYKAIAHLKQQRRLEQTILRVGLINNAAGKDMPKLAKYFKLNAEAIRTIKRKLNLDIR